MVSVGKERWGRGGRGEVEEEKGGEVKGGKRSEMGRKWGEKISYFF
jgi:hypothetical protein